MPTDHDHPDEADPPRDEVLFLRRDDYGAGITPQPDGCWRLRWTDWVANDWTEFFPTLDLALARLALLERAARRDRTFAVSAPQFIPKADLFLDSCLTPHVLTVGKLKRLLEHLPDTTQITMSKDDWYVNVEEVRLPDDDGLVTVVFEPGESFDTRQL